LRIGSWELTRYDRKDDRTSAYRPVDDLPAHVQAEGGGELSVPEGADVPEVPRQAGADARRERPREVRGVRPLFRWRARQTRFTSKRRKTTAP
jgi:hypothetical protein